MSTNEILRELISFLEAGYSLNTSLELLTKITEDARILQLKKFLSEGQTLEEAFSKLNWDPLFLEYFIFFLRSGQLKEALQQSLNILETSFFNASSLTIQISKYSRKVSGCSGSIINLDIQNPLSNYIHISILYEACKGK